MPWVLNVFYLLGLLIVSPWLAYKAVTTGKYRRGVAATLLGLAPRQSTIENQQSKLAWFHGVSVGEIHLLRQVVAAFRRRRPDWRVVVSTTTDTGFDEARKHFPDLPVFFWPLDFSRAVR